MRAPTSPTAIEAAGWFDLDHLQGLPNRISVARRLIDHVIAQIRAGAPATT